jgi:hypothetical protein
MEAVMSRSLLVLLFILLALPARAAVVRDLYQAQVPVAAQSPAELKRAARAGLAEVLVRVSGRSDAAGHTALKDSLSRADRYIEQYRYDTVAASPGEGGEAPAPQPVVQISFSPTQIQSLLRQAQLPIWGANRPTLMVWLALDEGGARTLVSEDSHPELVAALRAEARRRGLLLSFPLLDLDDLAAVTTDLVWQMETARLVEASQRYRADGVLAGRMAQLPGDRWLGGLRLHVGDERIDRDGEGSSLEAYLVPSIDWVADTLASRYAVVNEGSGPGAVLLELANVASYADYSRVLAYVGRLPQVNSVIPVQVEGDVLLLRLDITGGLAQLQRALALDPRLQPQAAEPLAPVVNNAPLRYRWAARG